MKKSQKSNPEELELKKVPYERNKKKANLKNIKTIFIVLILINLCVITGITCLIYFLFKKNYDIKIQDYESRIQAKDNEIENIQKQLKDKIEEKTEIEKKITQTQEQSIPKQKNLSPLENEYLFDEEFYKKHNMAAEEDLNRLGYSLIFHTHTLEKGLSHFDLRPFGKQKVESIMNILNKELKYENHEKHFSFINGLNSLREYKKVYEEHKWTDKEEYKKVSDFIKNYENVPEQKTGAYVLTSEELKKDYNIDYKKFIKSRHSTRNYKNQELKIEDIKEAIEMAKYTASACNRQFIKVHYYPSGEMRQNVIKYAVGKGGLYLEGVNTFIITFDVNGLNGKGERNQGYFNAGLFSTNFINALHSLGIGTCLIQFSNSVKEEETLKQLNQIPSYERVAVILFAGYYDDKSIFCVSPRKDVDDYLKEHK